MKKDYSKKEKEWIIFRTTSYSYIMFDFLKSSLLCAAPCYFISQRTWNNLFCTRGHSEAFLFVAGACFVHSFLYYIVNTVFILFDHFR